jgi:hypothetical protein
MPQKGRAAFLRALFSQSLFLQIIRRLLNHFLIVYYFSVDGTFSDDGGLRIFSRHSQLLSKVMYAV